MAKIPEAQNRLFKNVFVCKKCQIKQKADPQKILKGKVKCRKCNEYLFRYFKNKRGRLVKLFLDEIKLDNVGITTLKNGKEPTCPSCNSKLGVITLIKGRPSLKVNRGSIDMRT